MDFSLVDRTTEHPSSESRSGGWKRRGEEACGRIDLGGEGPACIEPLGQRLAVEQQMRTDLGRAEEAVHRQVDLGEAEHALDRPSLRRIAEGTLDGGDLAIETLDALRAVAAVDQQLGLAE